MPEPLVVIGVGVDGLDGLAPQARRWIERADQIWAGERLLGLLPQTPARKVKLGKNLVAELEGLKQRPKNACVVLLASGDPGFFGLGSSLLGMFPPEELLLIPQVSVLQSAFARARLSWSDAHFTSAHARPLSEVLGYARRFRKLGLLTDPSNTPARVAECLLAAGLPDCQAIVFENLGTPAENMLDTRLSALPGRSFASLNVLLLVQDDAWQPLPLVAPRPDDAYAHRNGLITKPDVRVLGISRLRLSETALVWDIGAGSGAVSIEMAGLAWRGKVFAVEKELACLGYLRQNLARFGVLNVEVVAGEAPQALSDLPAPGAVFIGGAGGRLGAILRHIQRVAPQGCRVVANFALLEHVVQAHRWMQRLGWEPSLTEVQLSYGSPVGQGTRLASSNPVFILDGVVKTAVPTGKD